MKLQMNASSPHFSKTRWIALAASMLLMSTLGIGYIWSLLVNPMVELRGATEAGMAGIYTALTASGAVFTIIGGKCVDKFGSAKVILSAVILSFVGELICAFAPGVGGFAFAQIILLAWQQSVIYIAVYTNVIKMFPDWKGLAIALSAVGITIGGAYMPVLCQGVINRLGFDMQFVVIAFVLLIFGLVALIFFPDVNGEAEEEEEEEIIDDGKFVQKDWKMMIKDPAFYLIFLAPLLGTTTYMLLNYQLAYIAQDILSITEMQSAAMVSAISVLGIVSGVLGPIGDKVGRLKVSVVIYAVGTVAVMQLIFANSHGVTWFALFAFIYAFCFGGFAGIHPTLVADLFGSKHYGLNYSICYEAVLAAAALSPWLGVIGGSDDGDYTKTFLICTIMCAAGLVLMIILWRMRKDNLEPKPQKAAKTDA